LPPHITKKDIAQILGLAFEELGSFFARSKVTRSTNPRFTFPRFGTFTKKKRSARRGVNPRTLEPMEIEACHTLDFKPSRELREAMNEWLTGKRSKSANTNPSKPTRVEVENRDAEPAPDSELPEAPLQRVRSQRSRTRVRSA
jgi:DNA-binding protein HU-beta